MSDGDSIEWIRNNGRATNSIGVRFDRERLDMGLPTLTEHDYIISADVSRGDAKDYSTFHIIDTYRPPKCVAEYKGKIRPDTFC